MFKNLLAYKFEENSLLSDDELNEQLEAALCLKSLMPCLTQEIESIGWLPVLDDQYVEKINNCLFINLGIETKQLPSSAVKTAVNKKIKEKGLKHVSRSEMKELTEIVMNELMPNALVVQTNMMAYIDLENHWLVVDAPSSKKASVLSSFLRKTIGSLPIIPLAPSNSITAAMTHWALHGIGSDNFSLWCDVELEEMKEEGGIAKFKDVALDSKEVQDLLKDGWQVTKLALSYDDKMAFILGGDFIFKRIKMLESFTENLESEDDPRLQAQADLYLAVDVYRNAIKCAYNSISSSQ